MHGVGALIIGALILHHRIPAGRHVQDPTIAGIWVVMFAIALFSLVYAYLATPLSQRKRAWAVQSVRSVGLKTCELTLDLVEHDGLAREASQFVSSQSLFASPRRSCQSAMLSSG